KFLGNGGQRRAVLGGQRVDRGVGVVHWNAHAPQHGGGGRFAHADRARQTDDAHYLLPIRSPATWRRNAASTCGSTPNQAAKPWRAWCNSMPNPSTVGLPRLA